MKTVNFEELVSTNNGKYVVISHYEVILGDEQGNYCFKEVEEAIRIKNKHKNLIPDIEVFLIQNGLNEYGVIETELIKCA